MSASGVNVRPEVLLLCRGGFESEAGQELVDRAGRNGIAAHARSTKGSGLVRVEVFAPGSPLQVLSAVSLSSLIFSRQMLIGLAEVTGLPLKDRVSPLVAACESIGRAGPWTSVEVLCAGHEAASDLQRFAGKFASPLAAGLRRAGLVTEKRTPERPLVVIFESFETAVLAEPDVENRAATIDGIPRLRFPAEAPSRSTLKLEEAWHTFIGKSRWLDLLGGGKRAVDLGAAPGGWTWQLVQQGMDVIAVDNGPMDEKLMKTEHVTHVRADGFTYRPPGGIAWMVCDMVEQPSRVLELVSRWLVSGWCRYTVFNLKLPMKRRYAEVQQCLSSLRTELEAARLEYRLAARQLYHDREEITCFVEILGRKSE